MDSIAIYGSDWKLQYMNSAHRDHTGWHSDEALGRPVWELHNSDTYEEIGKTLAQGKPWTGRLSTQMRDGRVVEEEATVSPVTDRNGVTTNYVSLVRDVTAQVQLEQQLFQTKKRESVGQLAAGITHDSNNLLGIFQGIFESLQDIGSEDERFHDWIECGLKTVKRGTSLTRRLLDFSKSVALETKVVSLTRPSMTSTNC